MQTNRSTRGIIERTLFGSVTLSLFALLVASLHGLPSFSAKAVEVPISLGVDTVLSLTVTPEDGLAIPITPNVDGVYSTGSLTAGVATNNITGFTLTFSSGESGTALINNANNETNTMPSTSGTVSSPTHIDINRWGFAVPKTQANNIGLIPNVTNGFDNTYSVGTSVSTLNENYATLPAYESPLTLKTTSTLNGVNNDNTAVYLGAHVNTAIPSGVYRGTVVFSAVGNYYISPMIVMQEFTASECNAMSNGETAEMIDRRDNNVYTIAKIGNSCWMAENLALGDEGSSIILTPGTSDVSSNWTLKPAYTSPNYDDEDRTLWFPANINDSDYCTPIGSVECGNLYNWYAATAGSTVDSVGAGNTAPNSICPANWRLPTGDANGEFAQLDIDLGGEGITNSNTDLSYLTSAPWSATFAGFGYWDTIFEQGSMVSYWSSSVFYSPDNTKGNEGYVYMLYTLLTTVGIAEDTISASHDENGGSIRCIFSP